MSTGGKKEEEDEGEDINSCCHASDRDPRGAPPPALARDSDPTVDSEGISVGPQREWP